MSYMPQLRQDGKSIHFCDGCRTIPLRTHPAPEPLEALAKHLIHVAGSLSLLHPKSTAYHTAAAHHALLLAQYEAAAGSHEENLWILLKALADTNPHLQEEDDTPAERATLQVVTT